MDELMNTTIFEPGMHFFAALVPARVLFETVEGSGAGGGEGGGEAAAVEPAAVEPAAVEPAAGDEPSDVDLEQAGLSREDYVALAQEGAGAAFREMMAEAERQEIQAREAQQAAQQREQDNQLPAWDPFDQNVVKAHQVAAMREVLAPLMELIQPALETTENVRMNEGRSQAMDILSTLEKGDPESNVEGIGEFDHDRAILAARGYMLEGGLEPEQALERAAREERAYVQKIEAAAYARFRDPAQNLADAGAEPGGGTGAAADVEQHPGKPGTRIDYRKALEGSLGRMGKGPGVASPTG